MIYINALTRIDNIVCDATSIHHRLSLRINNKETKRNKIK